MAYKKIGGYKTHTLTGDRSKKHALKRARRRFKNYVPVKVTTVKRINGHPWVHRVYLKKRKRRK